MQRHQIKRVSKGLIKGLAGKFLNIHRKGGKKDIFIFATRRSGSTWLMDIIHSQSGIKYCDQPLDLGHWNFHKHNLPEMQNSKFIYLDLNEERIVENYFSRILNGKIQVQQSWNIFRKDYSFFSNRSVVKICNGHSLIDWFEQALGIQVIYLIRHPIPTALSIMQRGWKDSVDAFLNNEFFCENYLDSQSLGFAKDIKARGTEIQILVLEWCLENLIPLRLLKEGAKRDWIVITYEGLVVSADRIIDMLFDQLDLECKDDMLRKVFEPSRTTQNDSKRYIEDGSKEHIINRWRDKVSCEEEQAVFKILGRLDIDAYGFGNPMPKEWILELSVPGIPPRISV